MGKHIIIGAGGIGSGTAQRLVDAGHDVIVVSRSGRTHSDGRVRVVALDATDATGLTTLALGADSIVNAANPASYTSWARDWPPMANAMLTAAERSGAGLVIVDNLYCYGRVDAPITESAPVRPNGTKGEVRAAMWREALAAHEAGRVRATTLRASDYFGPGCGVAQSFVTSYVIKPAAEGKAVQIPMGRVDVPHAMTYVPDAAALAALLATGAGWGEVWHVPSPAAHSMRAIAAEVAQLTGRTEPKVTALPRAMVTVGGLFVPLLRGLWETRHQFEQPWLLDSAKAECQLQMQATPWDEALRKTVESLGYELPAKAVV